MDTQAVLISACTSGTRSPNWSGGNGDLQTLIANRIRGVIAAKKYVLLNYNVPRSMLPEVVKITPGKRAPTVSPLEGKDWVAISVMVERKSAAQVMDSLEDRGASDILMFDIINSRLSITQSDGLTHQGLDPMVRLHIWIGFTRAKESGMFLESHPNFPGGLSMQIFILFSDLEYTARINHAYAKLNHDNQSYS
jgi:ATP phosphoribosyltransferase-like protein